MRRKLNLFWVILVVLIVLLGAVISFMINSDRESDDLIGDLDDGGQSVLEGEVGALDHIGEGERVITEGENGSSVVVDAEFCFDPDEFNYSLKSWTNSSTGNFADSCLNETSVIERYCNGTSGVFSQIFSCESACFEGACLPVPLPLCYDSDNRNHGEAGIAKYFGNKSNGLTYSDSCSGQDQAIEYYCEDDWVTTEIFNCEYGCTAGVCNSKPEPQCVDSDVSVDYADGINHLVKGNATYFGGIYYDSCNNLSTSTEWYCEDDVLKLEFKGCSLGCSAGLCINNPPRVSASVEDNFILGWYSFDEDKEQFHGLDSSVRPDVLVPVGDGASILVDDNNSALYLDGSTYFELVPNKFPFPFKYPEIPRVNETTDYDFTFSTWFKTNKSGVILGQTGSILPPNVPYVGSVPAVNIGSDGKLRTSVFWDGYPPNGYGSERYVSNESVNDSIWHNVVVTYGQGEEKVYLDGSLVNTRNFVQTGYASSYAYTLGTGYFYGTDFSSAGWSNYEGLLDKVLFFQQVLTSSEIQGLYSEGRAEVVEVVVPPVTPPISSSSSSGGGGGGGGGSGGTSSSSGSSGGAVVSGPKVYDISNDEFVSGYTQVLKLNEKIQFKFYNVDHYVKLTKLNGDLATLEVASSPNISEFKVNESKKYDLINDSYFDVKVTLNGVNSNNANVSLILVHESIPQEEVGPDEEVVEKNYNLYYIIGLLILAGIVYSLWRVYFLKKFSKK
ncbi:hypothetical protein COU54_00565 [Candidatus Pacearchaeota archaeon CG10_big_fil_rev_8_21_14_0_10_31_24]|nr:MAG: hypothetical protein COU54_00565 [Candidatus Pacearchaeota archaeon CG10_big_fil_rev_8_21_14_0_10_31_24]